MAGPGFGKKAGGGGKKKAIPFNTYVQRDRQVKYQEKKKVLSRFKRYQRYEERQAGDGEREHVADRVLREAKRQDKAPSKKRKAPFEEDEDDEYEKALRLSFGVGDSLEIEKSYKRKAKGGKRERRRREEEQKKKEEEAGEEKEGEEGQEGEEVGARSTKEKRAKKKDRQAEAAAAEEEASLTGKKRKQSGNAEIPTSKKARTEAAGEGKSSSNNNKTEAQTGGKGKGKDKGKEEKGKGKGKGKGQNMPLRYSKALQKYEEAQQAKAAEKERIEEEAREKNRRRKQTAKNRAVTGQILSKTTSRGQPIMKNVLELMTKKLMEEQPGKPGSSKK